jgi:hypothetical protein
MCTTLKTKPTTTIAEVLSKGEFWECTMNGCHLPFQSEKALRQHFTQAHADCAIEGWETKSRRLAQRWSERIEETELEESEMGGERNRVEQRSREEGENKGSEGGPTQVAIEAQGAETTGAEESNKEGEGEAKAGLKARARRIRRGKRRGVKRREAREEERQRRLAELRRVAMEVDAADSIRDHESRINPHIAAQREMQESAETERQQKCAEFIRKEEQYERNISRGVNSPQLNADQMRRVRERLKALFKGELNQLSSI